MLAHLEGMLNKGNFYPRSPRGERQAPGFLLVFYFLFLSTLPARGATKRPLKSPRGNMNFYPRSPRGERLWSTYRPLLIGHISIHAPREGSDLMGQNDKTFWAISIHAPREGSDSRKRRKKR